MIESADIEELIGSIFIGVTVGVGSQVMNFDNNTSILIQCGYRCLVDGRYGFGDGEQASTATCMFPLLNKKLIDAKFESDFSLTLNFDGKEELKIIPDSNGMESYVISTKNGIVPVMLF